MFRSPSVSPLLLGLLLLTATLAGCTSADDGPDAPTFAEAMAAEGITPEPTEVDGAEGIALKLVEPADVEGILTGQQPAIIALYNEADETPVSDATVTLQSWMPAMSHGTSNEEDPSPAHDGVYVGQMNPSMAGNWTLTIEVETTDGGYAQWIIDYTVVG